jgi:hypothetical protein
MNRAAALAYLTSLYGSSQAPYLKLAGVPLTDTADGVGVVIDDALLAVGTAFADLATAAPTATIDYRAALRFYALDFAWQNINSPKFLDKAKAGDVEVVSVEWRKHLKAARDEALEALIGLGIIVTPGSWPTGTQFGMLGINLDYLQQPVEGIP